MGAEAPGWVRAAPDGCILRLWVGPGASRAGVAGLHGGSLRVRVVAPPEGGAANRELLRLLASVLGVSGRALRLESGAAGRQKDVRVRGLRVEDARERLAPLLSVDRPRDEA